MRDRFRQDGQAAEDVGCFDQRTLVVDKPGFPKAYTARSYVEIGGDGSVRFIDARLVEFEE